MVYKFKIYLALDAKPMCKGVAKLNTDVAGVCRRLTYKGIAIYIRDLCPAGNAEIAITKPHKSLKIYNFCNKF